MPMKIVKNETKDSAKDAKNAYQRLVERLRGRVNTQFLTAMSAVLVMSVAALFVGMGKTGDGEAASGFEKDKVAERDFRAPYSAVYIDVEKSRAALNEALKSQPAVFRLEKDATDALLSRWERFAALCLTNENNPNLRALVMQNIGVDIDGAALSALQKSDSMKDALSEAGGALRAALDLGVFEDFRADIARYSQSEGELIREDGKKTESAVVELSRVLTMNNIAAYLASKIYSMTHIKDIGVQLLVPFVGENVFFSDDDTKTRLAAVHAEPVLGHIERGERIIKRGFIVTEQDMDKIAVFGGAAEKESAGSVAGHSIIRILIALFILLWGGKRIVGRALKVSEVRLLCVLGAVYFVSIMAFKNFSGIGGALPVSVLFPTAICVMLPSFLIRHKLGLVIALTLPLWAFLSGFMDNKAFIYALASGIPASLVLHGAQKRMDLVKAGLQIAGAQTVAMVAILLAENASLESYLPCLFWGAFNGAASGMLVLGLLPMLENALNAVTSFRLVELSDVNAPTLKRLFSVAPGTYSHSMMVATLAEAAAQEIGANALLARVGGYYHDIGKMDQSDYFVENQGGGANPHDDISPRLSATILRSHVKIGVERARSMGLPGEVVDIIAEHHGNSLIRWFYNAAQKREGQVEEDDFRYPGSPPRTRESACVMLADVTEAAARTLEKPSASRLEKFIAELINAKITDGQLSLSEMTFRDLATVEKTFVRVLAGYYHSRIEYPKTMAAK